jgi:hypothetical protein
LPLPATAPDEAQLVSCKATYVERKSTRSVMPRNRVASAYPKTRYVVFSKEKCANGMIGAFSARALSAAARHRALSGCQSPSPLPGISAMLARAGFFRFHCITPGFFV